MTARHTLTGVLLVLLVGTAASAQFGPGGGFSFDQPERTLVTRFDRDKNGRLDAEERAAARQFLATQPGRRRGRFGSATATPGRKVALSDITPPYPSTPLYDAGTLRTVFLQFERDDWEAELADFYNSDVEVPATVTVDGQTYTEVGVHFRGNSSFRMVRDGFKRSLNLAFDFVRPSQTLRGVRTLNLLNSHEDPTYLHTVLANHIAREYLPAPRANFVRVVINGEDWGVYVNAEQFNKQFLERWYKDNDGARWKVPGNPRARGGLEYIGEEPAGYKRVFEIKSKDTEKAWADLIRLCRILNQTPPDQLVAALTPILDIDETLKFLALDITLNNGDGYWTRASDYSLYEDRGGRFHVLPSDTNESFAAGGRGFGFGGGARPSPELDPLTGLNDTTKPLRSKLLAVPELRTRYLGYVRTIAETWLDWTRLGPIAEGYQRLIADQVQADTRKLDSYDDFPADRPDDMTDLRAFVEERRTYLLRYDPDRQLAR